MSLKGKALNIERKSLGFLCKGCEFLDYTGEIDKCPYCRGEDWKRVEVSRCKDCRQWKSTAIKKETFKQ